jgi:hypothetical protein
MPKFGLVSLAQLATCDIRLQKIANEAIKIIDFSVIEGFRGKDAQNAAYAKGLSKLPWPLGNHNKNPSYAMDCAPFPVDWSNNERAIERFVYMQGIFYAVSKQLGIRIRQGIDWNSNQDMRDEHGLHDYPHIEVVD